MAAAVGRGGPEEVLEVELQRRVCLGLLDQVRAQREVADDWAAAYTRYVGGALVGAPGYGEPVATATPARLGIRERLKAEAWRLARRWIFGKR